MDSGVRKGTLKLLFVAPERFANERFLEMLSRTKISLFAVDEAHCISEWGHNFRPDYLKLAEIAEGLKVERVLALTATATPSVVRDICAAFRIPHEAAVLTGFYRSNLEIMVTPTRANERDERLEERIASRPAGPTIVYVTLQKTAERVAAALKSKGHPAEAYHAGLESDARSAAQDRFMASDRSIVVATIAFGMGIDKSNVRYVYHYNLPKSLESYSQEIGRAGRDDQKSVVELFASHDDVTTLESFAYGDTPTLRAIERLVKTVLGGARDVDLSLYELSDKLDLRPIVLRTALTYLEIEGILRQKTPYYAGYRVKLAKPREEVVATFKGEPARFLAAVLERAKPGRIWLTLDPGAVAEAIGQERSRVVKALEVLEERGLAELAAADLRHRFERLREVDLPALAHDLTGRFVRREAQEIDRVRQVLALVENDGCITNALVGHFGEVRDTPCGHCSFCTTGARARLFPRAPLPPIDTLVDLSRVRALREEHPNALDEPRKLARALSGLSSPALSRAKIPRTPIFGCLEGYPFGEVLAYCEGLAV